MGSALTAHASGEHHLIQGLVITSAKMHRIISLVVFALCLALAPAKLPSGDLCRPSDQSQGGCKVDGSGCDGTPVAFSPYNLTISKWDSHKKNYTRIGKIESHAIVGAQDTWQMYLHGPRLRPTEK